jgi:hypothetical protein
LTGLSFGSIHRENQETSIIVFTGVGTGHPRLAGGLQFVTTEIQEIHPSCEWGRTKSRVYNLFRPIGQEEFTSEVLLTVQEISWRELSRTFDVEWVSIDDWRSAKTEEKCATQDVIETDD